jgi:Cellulase (glycosyl hydrolase family 5)
MCSAWLDWMHARGGRPRYRLSAPLLAVGATAVLGAGWLTATGPATHAATAGRMAPAASGAGAGYWHTSGNQILDSNGNPVRIAGVNWYGFETPDEIAHGLWAQDYHTIINDIKNLGYNTIRIPFSNQMAETPIVPQNLSFYNTGPINTDLKGLNSLQILDKIIAYAGQEGLKIILKVIRTTTGQSPASPRSRTAAMPTITTHLKRRLPLPHRRHHPAAGALVWQYAVTSGDRLVRGQRSERPAGRQRMATAQRDGSRLCPRGPSYMRCR